ncbi:hypothetical protein BC567DRAFT_262127 [Phyllosticta citribraziliensis]
MSRWVPTIVRNALNAMRGNAHHSRPKAPQKLNTPVDSHPREAKAGRTKPPCVPTPLTPKEILRAKKLEEQRAWDRTLDEFLKNPSTHQRLAPYA